MSKSVKTFDELAHQNTTEEPLLQIDAHMIFTMREQSLDLIAYKQWHKRELAYTQFSPSAMALMWFLRLHESYKNK